MACLVHSLEKRGLRVQVEVPISIQFDELSVPTAYRADILVEEYVLLELKATEQLLAVHCAQAKRT